MWLFGKKQKTPDFSGGGTVSAPLKGRDTVPFETCVLCGKETDILQNVPILFRKYYIRGGGQLCKNCYAALRTTPPNGHNLTEKDLTVLLQLSSAQEEE